VHIYTVNHPLDPDLRRKCYEITRPVVIKDNVWIGGSTVVNPGVTIGKDSVIGSGSVVTRDVPDGVLAAGNPCRVIRKLMSADEENKRQGIEPGDYPPCS